MSPITLQDAKPVIGMDSDDDQVDPNKACRIAMTGLRNTSFVTVFTV